MVLELVTKSNEKPEKTILDVVNESLQISIPLDKLAEHIDLDVKLLITSKVQKYLLDNPGCNADTVLGLYNLIVGRK